MNRFDLVVRGGLIADGSGSPLRRGDVAINGDRIVAVGEVPPTDAPVLDAEGAVVAPGLINVLSHAYGSLQIDPRGLSDLYQGVTTEVFGEGYSPGPVAGRMSGHLGDDDNPGLLLEWPRIGDFLEHMETTGVGPNVASFVGAHNLRMIHAGMDDRPLSEDELAAACRLLDEELSDGALGVGSALIYAPGTYASTAELVAYAEVLARHDALYISHIRDESQRLLDAVREVIDIARTASVRAEIYHLKAAGTQNWGAMEDAIALIDAARHEGLQITADIYPYEAGSTRLAACIPPRFHEGGRDALVERLREPRLRDEIKAMIAGEADDWEHLYRGAGGASGILLLGGPDTDYNGLTVEQASSARGGGDPIDTLLDLVIEANPLATYFVMTEANVHRALQEPWVSVCSDSAALAAESPFVDTPTHPRAYGSFARVLGPYVRNGVLPLVEAVRRMTSLPATNLRLRDRGVIRAGAFADLAIFDPEDVQDMATYEQPHRYASGMRHVVINGAVAFRDGEPTGQLAGRALQRDRENG